MPDEIKPDDPRIGDLQRKIDEVAHDAQTTTSWGLFFTLLAVIALFVVLVLALETASSGVGTPLTVAIVVAAITLLITALEHKRETSLIEELRALRGRLQGIGGANDGK